MAKKTRASKPDFAPYYKKHLKVMQAAGLDSDAMVKLRRHIHKNAEGGFQEFKTQASLKAMLLRIGVRDDEIKVCAGTGLVVDLKGRAAPTSAKKEKKEGTVDTVALRADMDALPMPENNPDLEYRTQTKFAHMCGHDGHMASLMSFTQVYCKNRDKIPSNKMVRLLF